MVFLYGVRLLKLVPLGVGMALMMGAGAALVFWPFIDALFRRRNPKSEVGTVIGSLGIIIALVFFVWEALAT